MTAILSSLAPGVAFGLGFNPLSSAIGAVAAAALAGVPGVSRRRVWAAWLVLVAAWAVGDARHLAALAGRYGDSATAMLVAAAVSFLVGYLLPASVGVYVGRRVTRGLGWPSAIAVALTISVAVSVLASPVSHAVWALAVPGQSGT